MKKRMSLRSRIACVAWPEPFSSEELTAACKAGKLSLRAKMLAIAWKVSERMNSIVPYSTSAPTAITRSIVSVSWLRLTITRSCTCIMNSGTVSSSRFTHRLRNPA